MLKHLLAGAVGLSSLALADSRRQEGAPVPPPPPGAVVRPAVVQPPVVSPAGALRDDRFDVRAGKRLLREFDLAVATRDVRSLRRIDAQFSRFIEQELAELQTGRFDREDRRTAEQLVRLDRQLGRLQGRIDHFSLNQKRGVFMQAVAIAERDLRDERAGRRR